MERENFSLYGNGDLLTSHRYLVSNLSFKARNGIATINLPFSKKFHLRHKTQIVPLSLSMMELNSNEYKLFEAFSLFRYQQVDLNFFEYKSILFWYQNLKDEQKFIKTLVFRN